MATGSSPEPLRNRVQSRLHLLKPKVTSGPPFLSEDLRIQKLLDTSNWIRRTNTGREDKKKSLLHLVISASVLFNLFPHFECTSRPTSTAFPVCTAASRLLAGSVFGAGCSSGCLESFYCRGIRVVAALHPRSRILQVRKAQSPDWLHVEHLGTAQTGRRILLRSTTLNRIQ